MVERVHMRSFAGAAEWLGSEPLGSAELDGRVVVVNFWDADVIVSGCARSRTFARGRRSTVATGSS